MAPPIVHTCRHQACVSPLLFVQCPQHRIPPQKCTQPPSSSKAKDGTKKSHNLFSYPLASCKVTPLLGKYLVVAAQMSIAIAPAIPGDQRPFPGLSGTHGWWPAHLLPQPWTSPPRGAICAARCSPILCISACVFAHLLVHVFDRVGVGVVWVKDGCKCRPHSSMSSASSASCVFKPELLT